MVETSFSKNLSFSRENPRKFKEDRSFKKVDNSYLSVRENQNILINSFDTGFFALTRKGESVSVDELRRRLERSVSKYQNAGEIPFDFNIDIEAKIIRQTFNQFMNEFWQNRGAVRLARDRRGRFIKFQEVNT